MIFAGFFQYTKDSAKAGRERRAYSRSRPAGSIEARLFYQALEGSHDLLRDFARRSRGDLLAADFYDRSDFEARARFECLVRVLGELRRESLFYDGQAEFFGAFFNDDGACDAGQDEMIERMRPDDAVLDEEECAACSLGDEPPSPSPWQRRRQGDSGT